MLLLLLLLLTLSFATVAAHPLYLDCGGLTHAIQNGEKIMGYVPKKVSKEQAKFQIMQPSSGTGYKSGWKLLVENHAWWLGNVGAVDR